MRENLESRMRFKRHGRKRFGPTQKKILLLLLGGFALSCARSPKKQWHIIKGMHETWKDISKQAAERAITKLYESRLLDAKENSDGTTTLILSDDGKKRALTYQIRYAKIKPTAPWDKKWRIIL